MIWWDKGINNITQIHVLTVHMSKAWHPKMNVECLLDKTLKIRYRVVVGYGALMVP